MRLRTSKMTDSTSNFKIIIVGGGPVGLLAAHALHKAGIDFVLLERRSTVQTHQGSSIGLGAPTIRVLDQLGLMDATAKLNHKLSHKYVITDQGKIFSDMYFATWLKEYLGYDLYFVHRSDLLGMLYSTLPDDAKAKILTSKRISDIESNETNAVVTCEDGTSYEGSLVLGADGVHSQVRKHMRTLALARDPNAKVDEERPFLTTYRCLFGYGPTPEGPAESDHWECHATNRSTQMMVGRDKTWFFVYEKLAEPTREKSTYSDKDKEQYADRLGDLFVHEKVRVRDVYKTAQETVLVDLEEGTVRNYAWGRLLLAGDAANKQTPNAGNGFNCGVQDIATLVSMLHGLEKSGGDGGEGSGVSMAAIEKMLCEYQTKRRKFAVEMFDRSALMTRMSTFDKWPLWLLDRYILPGLGLDRILFEKLLAPKIAACEVLSFLPEANFKEGSVPWKHKPLVQEA
ncbi:hypothetical protein Micbo1qcDRAFT_229401 [Microdochium bolleyi]|uniref:FAD-binding domain-containing protein n=1 Tax=Microdochium bolleyi TaxID=196109 RepID=A0A136JHA1_9PEZI|nr:hypothetical protein Micbo1qcDRAFT_229401 [Microdochium bolleyi]